MLLNDSVPCSANIHWNKKRNKNIEKKRKKPDAAILFYGSIINSV